MTKVDILQGTLDMLVLKTLSNDPMHGFAIALRIRQLTDEAPNRRGITLPGALQDGAEGVDQG
jgi:PadR family transcriptional regulator PadR